MQSGALFILSILILSALELATGVTTFDTTGKSMSLGELMNISSSQIQGELEKSFRALDTDQDGKVSVGQLVTKLNESTGILNKQPQLKRYVKYYDPHNRNKIISMNQLQDAVITALDVKLIIDAPICFKAKEVMKHCTRTWYSLRDYEATFQPQKAAIIYSQCITGTSGLANFTTEICIMNVTETEDYVAGSDSSCKQVKQCIQKHFHYSSVDMKSMDLKEIEVAQRLHLSIWLLATIGNAISPTFGALRSSISVASSLINFATSLLVRRFDFQRNHIVMSGMEVAKNYCRKHGCFGDEPFE